MKVLAWFLALSVGFLSLSQEVLWIRVVGFIHQGVPQSFALVLGVFLLGIAGGASVAKRICLNQATPLNSVASIMVIAGGVDLLLPSLLGLIVHGPFAMLGICALIFLTAALKGAIFPVAHQLGCEAGEGLGRSLSRVYFMNIVGSTLGPLFTGFVLLDYVSLSAALTLIGLGALLVAGVTLLYVDKRAAFFSALLLAGVSITLLHAHDDGLVRQLAGESENFHIKHVVENRHGILHVADGDGAGDIVFGGNVYDGRINIDLVSNSNKIDRVYLLSALHDKPARILVIGLSTGAWTRVLSAFSGVESIDVVEINPGYLNLIAGYPEVAPLLRDPKIKIHVNDGRRWLRLNSGRQFDLIVMNTSFHWRANSSNLLSREFMRIARDHLAPNGILAFNATGSQDAFFTAAQVFPHSYRWGNFIYSGDSDFRDSLASASAKVRLQSLQLEGVPLFSESDDAQRLALEKLLKRPFVTVAQDQAAMSRPMEIITDSNMINEYKFGTGL